MENSSFRKGQFPPQKVSGSKKTDAWYDKCLLAAEQLSFLNDSRIRSSWGNKKANYDLANDILDMSDVKRVTNPFQIEGLTIPAKMQNYPIALPKIDLLVGEEMKRKYDWRVRITNEDAVTQKQQDIQKHVNETLMDILTNGVEDEEEFQKRMKKINDFKNYEYQDVRERRATQLLKYLWSKEGLKTKFSKCFTDLLIASEELMCVDIIAGEPVVRKVNPLELHVISNGDSPYVEDADIIIEDGYYPPGQVIDMFHEELTDKQVKRIMDGDISNHSEGRFSMGQRERSIIPTSEFETIFDPDTGMLTESNEDHKRGYRGAFDLDGNIRVMRCVWRGLKKIGKISYMNPETGEMEEDLVPEGFKTMEGETVKWVWINEWYEGTLLGAGEDSIRLKKGPRPIQFREMDNLSKCHSGYIGTYMNINDSRAYSLLDRMKPYQYLYNVYMYRTEQAFAKSHGKILNLPIHLVPDDWEFDQWLNYLFQMNIMVTDAFKEGDKGAAQGKIAGNFQSGNLVADLEMGNFIQQHIGMLEYIKKELGEIAGVTEQRQGQIETRELVGNVQRAVTQSSHITEKWFQVHEDFKNRVMQMLLETAKYAYRDKKLKRQMIFDDMTNQIFEIDGDEIMECDYGIFVSNSERDTQLYEELKMLSQAALQNDKLTFTQIMDIYTSDSIASIKRKIQTAEEEKMERDAQMQQEQLESQERMAEELARLEQEKLDIEERNNVRDNQTKILIKEMDIQGRMLGDQNNNGLEDHIELKKHKDALELKRKELEDKMKMHKDKMQREDKKIRKMGISKSSK